MALATLPRETLRPFHVLMLGLGGTAMSVAAFDLSLLSFALAEVRRPWGLEPWQLSIPMITAAVGGIGGAAAAGQLADRFGRRGVFQITMLGCALGTAASALAPNVWLLAAAQLVVGAGVNGLTPAAASLLSEVAPSHARGRLTALLQTFWVLGGLVGAVAAYLLIPVLGWRGLMALGGAGIGYVWVLRRWVPESPRYLVARGYIADAFALRERLAVRWGVSLPLPSAGALPPPLTAAGRFRELWAPRYRRRTGSLWCLWFVSVFAYRGIFPWLPTLLILTGQTADQARLSVVVITLAQVPSTAAMAMLADRVGRKPLLVSGLVACCLASLLFGFFAYDAVLAVAVGAVLAAGQLATNAISLVYTPELYPTRIRATGAGMASAFGRIAAVIAPATVGALLAAGGGSLVPVFGIFSATFGAGAVVVGLAGEETRGRTLEEISD